MSKAFTALFALLALICAVVALVFFCVVGYDLYTGDLYGALVSFLKSLFTFVLGSVLANVALYVDGDF